MSGEENVARVTPGTGKNLYVRQCGAAQISEQCNSAAIYSNDERAMLGYKMMKNRFVIFVDVAIYCFNSGTG